MLIVIFLLFFIVLLDGEIINRCHLCKLQHLTCKTIATSCSDYGRDKLYNGSILQLSPTHQFVCCRKSNRTHSSILNLLLSLTDYKSTCIFFDIQHGQITNICEWNYSTFPLEDGRLFKKNEQVYCICTEFYSNEHFEPVVFSLDKHGNKTQKWTFDLGTYDGNRLTVKNWNMFEVNERCYVLTDVYPWRIYEAIFYSEIIRLELVVSKQYARLSKLRCSSAPCNNLIIVHRRIDQPRYFPTIRAAFIKLENYLPIAMTKFICFDEYEHCNIQFVSGLSASSDSNKMLVSLGFKDEIVKIVEFDTRELEFSYQLCRQNSP